MPYSIWCKGCNSEIWAANIVELIDEHTDDTFGTDGGMLICKKCGKQAYIYRESKLQEKGSTYKRYIKGVLRLRIPEDPTYFPYIFLNSSNENGDLDHIHFNYYKDTRSAGGRLKHGHGPGGAPVFEKQRLLDLIRNLTRIGFLMKDEI